MITRTGHRWLRRPATLVMALLAALALILTSCTPPAPTATIPGVGRAWQPQFANHRQVIVASGDSPSSTVGTVTLYDRTAKGWTAAGSWRAWIGRSGWAFSPASGSGASPIGVFSLTAAGGYAPNPGSRLPYDYNPRAYSRVINGLRTFNRVVAVDINHVPYSSPNDFRRPSGPRTTYGIWLHDTHNSPTSGCIALPDTAMLRIQLWLNPAARPIILMGPAALLRF